MNLKPLCGYGLALGLGLTALAAMPAAAQEVVAAAPSNSQAIAAGDVASVAVAQINDQAVAVEAQKKIDLYKQLMELNGESRNIRNVIDNTKTSTKLILIERAGATALNPVQEAQYNKIADPILQQTESTIIDETAATQAQSFSLDEIQQLIAANSSIPAAKYNSTKFLSPQDNSEQVQQLMIAAVIRIVTQFRDSVAS